MHLYLGIQSAKLCPLKKNRSEAALQNDKRASSTNGQEIIGYSSLSLIKTTSLFLFLGDQDAADCCLHFLHLLATLAGLYDNHAHLPNDQRVSFFCLAFLAF